MTTVSMTATVLGLMTTDVPQTCAFCEGDVIKNQVVYSGTDYQVLVDYAPIVEGHLLIVPKSHVATADELNPESGKELLETIKKVKKVFKSTLETDDYIILQKNGKAAGQSVPHVHFHMIPIKSTGWRMLGQLKIFFKILFGSSPESKEARVISQKKYREAFDKIS